MPFYSIITINYNNRKGLSDTISSVLSQDYKDFEYIIIDGGSQDGSKDEINKVKKDLSFYCSEPDGGIYPAMNKGIDKAKGEYILFLNSGDTLHNKNVLQEMRNQMNDHLDIVSGYAVLPNGNFLNHHENNVLMMLMHSTFSHQATFIKRKLFDKYRYDENERIISDWKAWLQWVILEKCSWKYVNTIVCNYDLEGISSSSNNWDAILKSRRESLESILPPLVVEQLYKDCDYYLKGHMKYIEDFPFLTKCLIFNMKILAICGKIYRKLECSLVHN